MAFRPFRGTQISEGNAYFEKTKSTPRDNAWKVVCTSIELNPIHINACAFEKIKNTSQDTTWKVVCTNFQLNPTQSSIPLCE